MSKVDFIGLGVAIVTPFNSDESVDYESLGKLIEFQISSGTDYIVALGTTAETPTLTAKEQKEIVRFIVKTVEGRIPIVVGIGDNCTSSLLEKVQTIDLTGVSAILSVTPYYNKPTQEGLYRHFCALSKVSPLPIILYNVPGRTGVNMCAETTIRIAKECKNVIATKEASGNLTQIKQIIDEAPEGFNVISGDDAITTDVVLSGGIGVISVFGNAYPKEMKWLVDSALKERTSAAREKMENDFNELFHLMFVEGNPAGVKALLEMKGLANNVVRLPLVTVTEGTKAKIQTEFNKFA
ncbi:MAG: 4-hydroxy-tetrahydrodipicolinate synthase [Proteiniphilum sp.]|nr:4-hydroxy-tetrahydrodipicolinate synthase [Proteiniphilum sp.]